MKNLKPNLKNYEKTYKDFSWKSWGKFFSFSKNGKVNYAYEVIDWQVVKGNGKKPAIVFAGLDGKTKKISFAEIAEKTNIIAKNLKAEGLKPGDRFAIYAPRSIEYALVLYSAIKCGAIAVPLFEAFGPTAIEDRLGDCSATWIYTTAKLYKNVPFTKIRNLKNIVTDSDILKLSGRKYFTLADLQKGSAEGYKIYFGNLETPFIIHYTSGSTAKPKGVLLVNRAMIGHFVTALYVLDLHSGDNYWDTGDPGWVTGMVYNFFAPLLHGIACHILGGPFDPMRWIDFMKKAKISVWYSTPTAFRLLRYYEVPLNRKNLPHLRHIASAGEPLNPSLIDWTMKNLGIPIHDSWYMTENGHHLINNYRCLPIRKGSMGKPFPGIRAAILGEGGKALGPGKLGKLVVKRPWPGLMKTIWGNEAKFRSYFESDWYISGDTAYKDKDGYFWFAGREDDMIKSGAERISPFEIESVLVSHPKVAEAAVIGKPHELHGNIVKAFIVLAKGSKVNGKSANMLVGELKTFVEKELSAFEVPREIDIVRSLPKTRSGKIMRRVLRARELKEDEGDLSTLDTDMTQK